MADEQRTENWMTELSSVSFFERIEKVYVDEKSKRIKVLWASLHDDHIIDLAKSFFRLRQQFSMCTIEFGYREMSLHEEQKAMQVCFDVLLAIEPTLKPIYKNATLTQKEPNHVLVTCQVPIDFPSQKQIDRKYAELYHSIFGIALQVSIDLMKWEEEAVLDFRETIENESIIASMEHVKEEKSTPSVNAVEEKKKDVLRFGNPIDTDPVSIKTIVDEMRSVTISGRIFGLEKRALQSGRVLLQFHVTDEDDSITCKIFLRGNAKKEQDLDDLEEGMYARIRGTVQFDTFLKEMVLMISDLTTYKASKREDHFEQKRIELHAHTQMSALDGVIAAADLVKQAALFGHEAVAITDHGVVQSYPEAAAAGKKHGVKILYGIEANLIDAGQTIVYQGNSQRLDSDTIYVVFDTETTGLSAAEHELIEIAGVKMQNGKEIDHFSTLIQPRSTISPKITEITSITNEMVADAPFVEEVLPQFQAFCQGAILVAHNAEFDLSFLHVQTKKLGMPRFDQPVIDTLALARTLFPSDRNHRLKTLTQKWDITLINHHRALADAEATGKVLYKLLETASPLMADSDLPSLSKLGMLSSDHTKGRPHHTTMLVKTMTGLKNLYKLVSASHLTYFFREPRMPRKLILEHREGLLIGTGCKYGEVFQALLRGKSHEEMLDLLSFYDYVEIQPPNHYESMIKSEEIRSVEQIHHYHRTLLSLADEAKIPVVATGDVHILNASDAVFRDIILSTGTKKDMSSESSRPLTYKTTQEMLDEFAYLGDRAKEVVIENPKRIAEQIEEIRPVPDRVYPPIMEGADDEVRRLSMEKVYALYGDPLPDVVKERVDKELHSIITNGFSVNYLIAHKLVTKSLSDGYIVGSRGSVGSSLVATLMDITEVNPLAPHYRCPQCQQSEFILDGSIGSGFDLPDKTCPSCGTAYVKDGQDIPFETFLGFKGDKVPDIDLNFSGEYQARAHKYTEELFGSEFVFRAGTISTIAEKTAFGYVKKWAEEQGRTLRAAEIARLVAGCTGIKRTTGQHPGGLIIVPSDHEIYDFCPIQHPADDRNSETRTTHFDFHSIHDNLLKLDILGHDDPTMLRMLQDITQIDARQVPVDDPAVYALFCGTASLSVTPEQIKSRTGTYGVPEFGTKFVRQMLEDTKPSTFADLVRISGLSHGTDVWLNNAQELIRKGTATLSEVICCRDDIMVYLIYRGLEPSRAFKIMESVRKGKGLSQDDETYMKSFEVKDWYMESCRRIKYMFPKAHAAAYVLNAVRIAYFKVHHPLAYYAAYFTVRAEDFDLALMKLGADAIAARIDDIEGKQLNATPKEKALQTVLEVALEMTRRGFRFYGLDLYNSESSRFLLKEDGLLPPFAAAPGIGESAARNIVEARQEAEFLSVEDLQDRARLSKTVIELLDSYGCLEGLPVSNQLSLF